MKKISAIIIALVLLFALTACSDDTSNDAAQEDKNGRYLTIINDTNQIINEVHITVDEGTEIEGMEQENPDEKSFSIKIPDAYSDYSDFTVILVDRYETKYIKEITDVADKGRTEVKVTEDDIVEEDESFKDKLDKFFNGD